MYSQNIDFKEFCVFLEYNHERNVMLTWLLLF